MAKSFIITGGNFLNTGAEAMSYTTISELRRRYPDCSITMVIDYGNGEKYESLKCKLLYLSSDCMKMLGNTLTFKEYIKAVIKRIVGKEDAFKEIKEFQKVIKESDAAFDISGYILSSQWDINGNINKLAQMNMNINRKIPYYVLPQSFGPFEYGDRKEWMISKIRETLSQCKTVYAREKEGYYLLKHELGLSNVSLSPDIVLQNRRIEWELVETDKQEVINSIEINKGSVAVVHNMSIQDLIKEEELIKIYSEIIEELLLLDKSVVLIPHSAEDGILCKKIKDQFEQGKVLLIEKKLDSRSFESIINKMDFAIASRFHSIVHAYKNIIPCIILGWAIKYKELAALFNQEEYVFDVRDSIDLLSIMKAEKRLNDRVLIEKEEIRKKLELIQESACFDELEF